MRSHIPGFPWTPNSDENSKEKSMKAMMEKNGYSIALSCNNYDLCFTRTTHVPNLGDKKVRTFQDNVALFDWAFPFDSEHAQRLVRAFTHLIDLLQAECRAKHSDKTDPFAK